MRQRPSSGFTPPVNLTALDDSDILRTESDATDFGLFPVLQRNTGATSSSPEPPGTAPQAFFISGQGTNLRMQTRLTWLVFLAQVFAACNEPVRYREINVDATTSIVRLHSPVNLTALDDSDILRTESDATDFGIFPVLQRNSGATSSSPEPPGTAPQAFFISG
ncbi:hypothetical protein MTO96_052302 [Rhipicephalus appendiculatus]